ncbi:MAG: Holliday junction resolvase-like protein [Candidatus Hodarchaeota archaeon]
MVLEFIIGVMALVILGLLLYIWYQRRMLDVRVRDHIQREQDRIRKDALTKSRAVLKGKIAEQMAPLLEAFPFQPADARFIGSPVDYIVFVGYHKNEPTEVVLVDIKTGNAQLSPIERKIERLVQAKRVQWMTVRV